MPFIRRSMWSEGRQIRFTKFALCFSYASKASALCRDFRSVSRLVASMPAHAALRGRLRLAVERQTGADAFGVKCLHPAEWQVLFLPMCGGFDRGFRTPKPAGEEYVLEEVNDLVRIDAGLIPRDQLHGPLERNIGVVQR